MIFFQTTKLPTTLFCLEEDNLRLLVFLMFFYKPRFVHFWISYVYVWLLLKMRGIGGRKHK